MDFLISKKFKKWFSKELDKRLKERKISHRKFAKEVGVSKSSISLYCLGERFPQEELFYKICEKLDIPFQEFYKKSLNLSYQESKEKEKQNNEKLYQNILEKQGDLLYTTLSEECAELIQACSKIQRKKYYGEGFEIDNLLEEINDVELNIELIKKQLIREPSLNITEDEINEKLQKWDKKKIQKLTKIFLEKGEKEL